MRITAKITILLIVLLIIIAGAIVYNFKKDSKVKTTERVEGLCVDCNVILVSIDSLRADHVGAFGYKRDTTPNFDKFAKEGALFLNYFITSFLTPVSEMSVHTGLYPSSHGVTNFDTVLPEDKVTITQYLKDKGYATSAILSSPEFEVHRTLKDSFSRSFDRYFYSDVPRQTLTQQSLDSEFSTFSDKKFFLWLAIGQVHWPYGEGSQDTYTNYDYQGYFKDKKLDWNNFQYVYQGIAYPQNVKISEADIDYVRDKYDNGVKELDDFIGQLVSQLERRNLLKKTIVIIQSEHGEDLGEHGYFAHYDVMDTQVHTPLLIFAPALGGQRFTSLSSAIDIFPTIVELIGYPIPSLIQGKSLVPIITGKEADGVRAEVFIERNPLWEEAHTRIRQSLEDRGIPVASGQHKDIAIRTQKWKYILRTSRERVQQISWWQTLTGKPINVPEAELYDLTNDPVETQNVIAKYSQEAEMLKKKLEAWYSGISSPEKIKHEKVIQPYF